MNVLSHFGDLPTIQTRKALLLLDFQNDFLRSSGALHVPNTAEFVELLPQLTNTFRRNGDVVWVRSHYESRRPLIGSDAQELVVLGRGGHEPPRRKPQSADDDDSIDPEGFVDDNEAFLSTESPQCCRPQSSGAQFPAPILTAINTDSDTIIDKSEYSALRNQNLILSFRTRFITELYLCGSLSNISVYATALDAVRHGFSVNLIEDCLGFRTFSRHEEAMRRMADVFGASGITTQELYEELDWHETDAIAREGDRNIARSVTPAGIEGVMNGLEVKPAHRATQRGGSSGSRSGGGGARRTLDLDTLLAQYPDDEDGDLLELAKLTRGSSRVPKGSASQPDGSTENKLRVRVRRSKRPDSKGESSARPGHRRSGRSKQSQDICKPGDRIGEGDSRIIYDLDLPSEAFEEIRQEVAWQKMYHMSGEVPRLVAVQGRVLPDGSIPVYRHPADESPPLQPFTPVVNRVRAIVERILRHPLNHVLIQLYRDGEDRISEHSDKTLDIIRGSSICNVSLGAQRVMVLRTKAKEADESDSGRLTQRIPMPHESLFVLGESTNMRWLHGIRPDKRPLSEKSVEERAYGGERISLTFRHIGTYLDSIGSRIWGQGAVCKSQDEANAVIHGDATETERLIRAFGEENRSSEFDWNAVYGGGFDVVNFVTTLTIKIVLGPDSVSNLRVLLALGENGLRYEVTGPTTAEGNQGNTPEPDLPQYIDANGTHVAGDVNILNHLVQHFPGADRPGAPPLLGGDKIAETNELLVEWRTHKERGESDYLDGFETWEMALNEQPYLGGAALAMDDCALWPVLREIVQQGGSFPSKIYPNLSQYYQRVMNRVIVRKTLEEMN
ncbi:hypothetical protein FE257_007436 [Aspergillus nanangensis]|uniref:Isochorismatase family protein family n=1 Tax=Aspergillus nanangensis TaxID=2582783 RepID=A0AAD4CMR2_ASPNN|nr:hypothetical protein FE257_007436 [Aspergillus nanangensis]